MTWFRPHRKTRSRAQTPPATRQIHCYEPAADALGLEIQTALTADKAAGARLRYIDPAPDGPEFDGYCAAASGAYFFLKGEQLAGLDPLASADTVDWEIAGQAARDAGFRAFQHSIKNGWSHWWLEQQAGENASQVIDMTVGPNDVNDAFPYERGRTRGFMQHGYKRPSQRATGIMAAVKATRRDHFEAPEEGWPVERPMGWKRSCSTTGSHSGCLDQ